MTREWKFYRYSEYTAGLREDKTRYVRPDEFRKVICDFLNTNGKVGWGYSNRYLDFHVGEHGASFLMYKDEDGTTYQYKFVKYKDMKPVRAGARILTGEEQGEAYLKCLAEEYEDGWEPLEWSTWGNDAEDTTYLLMRKRVEMKAKTK